MKNTLLSYLLVLCCYSVIAQNNIQRTQSFDNDWLFKKGDLSGAENPDYNDAAWRKLNVPHDWSIEDLQSSDADSTKGPFSKNSIGKGAVGHTVGGIGWYRKKFIISNSEKNKIVYINFDGVYMNSDVWLNGRHLGNHPYGYTPFYYDLTPYLKPAGQENVLAVCVKNVGKNSRWYNGSGIYRHVDLTFVNPVHIAPQGLYVTSSNISAETADVNMVATIANSGNTAHEVTLLTELIDPHGKKAGSTQSKVMVDPSGSIDVKQNIKVSHPQLWSVEKPALYTVQVKILTNGMVADELKTPFGIRSVNFSVNGFALNGKIIKLKGGCIHHDNGPLGTATIDRAEIRKIEILKANGYNAIRTSHNPPSRQLLDACDRLGMLVMDEAFDAWNIGKNDSDYHLYFKDWWDKDITSMLMRDRNHPSIILWSIGNEIPERADTLGLATTRMLVNRVHQLDSTRPVTEAVCTFWEGRNRGMTWENNTPEIFKILDVGGYNYQYTAYQKDHAKYPERIMVGTESFPLEAYENWKTIEQSPYVIGDFVWTAFDYIGEAALGASAIIDKDVKHNVESGAWPWFDSFCGDFDLTGAKKAPSYYRDVVWDRSKVEVLVRKVIPPDKKELIARWGWPDEVPSWSWPGATGDSVQVRVFSKSSLVQLFLNGKKVGEQKTPVNSITSVFKIPYYPGVLTAKCFDNGKETGSKTLITTGVPRRIRLIAERKQIKANVNDLAYVSAEIVDEKGRIVPYTDGIDLSFHISGNAKLIALGNGNPVDVSSFQRMNKKTWRGRCLAIVQPNGKADKITISAVAKGLSIGSVEVNMR